RRLEAQITVIPNEPAPYIELGSYYIDHGNMDEGIRHYQRAIRIEPSGIDGHFYLAQAYEKKGLNCLAETEYRKVIKNQSSHIEAYLHLGTLLLMKKDFDGSSLIYSNLITIKNDIPEAHYGLGISYMGLKKYKSARTSLEKALEIGFASADLYFNLAMIYYEQEHLYDKAEEYLKIAISRNLAYPEAHLYLGNIYYTKKLLHEAMWQYEEVIQLKSDYAIAYSNLGAVYNDLNMLDKAEENYYRALQLDRNIAEAHRNLGVLYQKRGEFLKAIDEMEIYLSLGEPEDTREIRKRIKDMEYKIKRSVMSGR
ncbi:MAG: tetratricopeptide repeat protein, partial [Candidatus Eremiobacterota bacterium]